MHITLKRKKAVLSQGGPRDAVVNFDTYRILHH